ncbi:flagellar basal body M-ring protein FliF [Rhodocyclus tenuis]|uniref:Flagellar M-ring protein n=2 Tax=Rhodocyclus TaxID=1064 RepID=A0A6L5JW50_RHOTE|nr:flagellar basal-body MS-ring/collar protein FliF [Rhodocyclus gracilis]MQY51585.1 flagellar basal body M-ring protein FliF [Rhodocyclus gracilis]NJA89155.1 flagellar basal body M-ring protein FliF [Rhodocyclus gracilis]
MAATTDSTAGDNANPGQLSVQLDRLREAFARLTNAQKILLAVTLATIVALLVTTAFWMKKPDYRVLFSNISERDGGAIIAALEQLNVPYRFNEGGSAILVPGEKVHEVRLRLATQGLPKGGGVGFELMENQKFGTSQFAEQVNYQRALEGELGKTIQSIAAVQAARVHLAIPKPSVFVREEQKPSASVLLNLYPGRALEPAQIAGIQNLVAASVPQLAPASVTLLDQSGAMISQLKSKLLEAGLDPTQIKYVQEIEASVIKRIEDILAPIVGKENARVQVAADIDFSQSEQTAETNRPNTTPPDITIRSQQTSETASVNPTPQGVPGALTNQPPVPATAPLTVPAVPGAGGAAATVPPGQQAPGQVNAAGVQAPIYNAGQPISTRKDATINYEVDRTIRHTKQSIGVVKRLSAAVVVNNRKDVGKDGKPTTRPLTDAELRQINDLVREAMGYTQERGDSLSVANAPFTPVEKADNDIPLWKDPEVVSLGKDVLTWVAIAAIIAYLLLGVVRPLVKTMFPPPPPPEDELGKIDGIDIIAGDEEPLEPSAAEMLQKKIDEARELAQRDPKVVANIIKDWAGVNGG